MGQTGRDLGLDGLRGVAAILVVLLHARFYALHGYLAVDLFFIMSGLVIAGSYEQRLASGRLSFRAYAVQRLWRLYPMLFAGGLVGMGICLAGLSIWQPKDGSDLALAATSQFLLIPFLAASVSLFPLNNPQWSILWEIAANFVHAAILARANNAVLLAVVAASACALAWYALEFQTLGVGVAKGSAMGGLARVGFGFFAGVLLHRTRRCWEPWVPRVHFAVPALIFALLACMPPSLVPNGPLFGLYDLGVVVLVLAPLVMLAARARAGRGAEALGQLSYPLYAINEPVVFALLFVVKVERGTLALAVAGLIVIAWIMGRYVDVPLNAWRRAARSRQADQTRALPA
jgi:peptidoglycan/LPS O-acetylase OafA/YrhL